MNRSNIDKVRAQLIVAGWSISRIADHFGVTRSAVGQVISGDSASERIQKLIEEQIGYWPWDRRPGEPRHV